MQNQFKANQQAEIDIHGLTVFEAEEALFTFLEYQPKIVKLVVVTHGYSRGTALKKMVKNNFHHWRIKSKQVGLNPGVTYILLK